MRKLWAVRETGRKLNTKEMKTRDTYYNIYHPKGSRMIDGQVGFSQKRLVKVESEKCLHCGKELNKGQKAFCSREHVRKYLWDREARRIRSEKIMSRAADIEKLAIKLELKRLEIESIKTKEEEKRKTLELQAQLASQKKKEWADTVKNVSDSCKKNALEKISASKNPRKSRREYYAELEEKKSKESDEFMENLMRIAKEIREENTAEIIASSDIEDGNGNNH